MPCTLKSFRLRFRRKLCESKRAVCTIKTKAAVKQNETPNRVWNKLLMIAECMFAWRLIYPPINRQQHGRVTREGGRKEEEEWGRCGWEEREKGWEGWMRWRKMFQPSEWDWDTCCRKKWGEKYVSERERDTDIKPSFTMTVPLFYRQKDHTHTYML